MVVFRVYVPEQPLIPVRPLCLTFVMLLLLNACGLKAPLYLPQKPETPQPQQSQGDEKQS